MPLRLKILWLEQHAKRDLQLARGHRLASDFKLQ